MLIWEDSYAIARTLKSMHPNIDLGAVSLEMIYHWVVALPEFEDDRELANDEVLAAIYQEWFEEAYPL
jgi:FeS assembly protein IscX